ncbi:glycine--tRNA ligase subunit beta [Roseomonas stagni]|uniref:Glycine--tRNA ligase beta subunit n=1 Tax=Falsiroseomonas algicola TaxID=2716930 RepID=A0A6M1LLC2_9PROT|nr:glycine--tRNA ligase subunit beta [Falsiroseomonas algicola]NGM20644.1 glycine--tRNA ligase subunit beta [Falsiroseomonas algicola]
MPDLLLELFSEEIPARMQARGAEDLAKAFASAVAPVLEGAPRPFYGPRRIGLSATLRAEVTTEGKEERGPRTSAPPAALDGFLKKHGATREMLAEQNGFWVFRKPAETVTAASLVASAMPALIRGFGWPKSMRWNGPFTWVRPLHRVLCVLDGQVVPFAIEELPGLVSGNETEGHRIMAAHAGKGGAFAVTGLADYEAGLRERFVVPDAAERMRIIEEGMNRLAAAQGVRVVPDRGLLEEVAGLVEWPVPLLGRIDDAFMDLPPELMRTTMRVNQRYFSLVKPDGSAAPFFALVANIAALDGGATLVAGNERVLRARLSDARFFWDQDRKQRLESYLPKLESVVFHAKLGTQGSRVQRLVKLARHLAPLVGADAGLAARAAELAKADLASGLVGEFPELQGIIGRYYALHQGEDPRVAEAIAAHYRPLGPGDAVPTEPVAIAVALADKLDTLAGFFAVDERPTGSGDPFALRRAALGVIRILRENGLRLRLGEVIGEAFFGFPQAVGETSSPEFGMAVAQEKLRGGYQAPKGSLHPPMVAAFAAGLVDFLAERLRVQLRAEGARHDLVAAAFGAGAEDDFVRLLARADALKALVEGADGPNLLAAYKRAANILRIEEKKDGPHQGAIDAALLTAPEEQALAAALDAAEPAVTASLAAENYISAMSALAALRGPLDAFFERVTVNDPVPELRRNRLRLLARLRAGIDAVADFSRIEG